MTFYRPTTDASDQYRPSSSSASGELKETAVPGNLADYMKNAVMLDASEAELLADGNVAPPLNQSTPE